MTARLSILSTPLLQRWMRRLVHPRAPSPRPTEETATPAPAVNAGWCSCCRSDSEFVETGVWLRDQYLCTRCWSIPRFPGRKPHSGQVFPVVGTGNDP
jgi:hypothetical protein